MTPASGPEESPSPAAAPAELSGPEASPSAAAAPEPELLSDAELDAIEDDLARAERTLSLLADDDIDPTAATAWLAESQEPEPNGEAVA